MTGGPLPVGKVCYALTRNTRLIEIHSSVQRSMGEDPTMAYNGNPIVPLYRSPAPASRPEQYTDPVTYPAADIAENPYYKRDNRRNYPQTAHYSQNTIAGLLQLGSVSSPRIAVGEQGARDLEAVSKGQVSLTAALKSIDSTIIKSQVLSPEGLPPLPPSLHEKKWTLIPEYQSGMYDESYPVRAFN